MMEIQLNNRFEGCKTENRWARLYCLAAQHKNSLEFYEEYVNNVKKLLLKNMSMADRGSTIEMLEEASQGLDECRREMTRYFTELKAHLTSLQRFIENPGIQDFELVQDKHEALEERITSFIEKWLLKRKKLFFITDNVIEENVMLPK